MTKHQSKIEKLIVEKCPQIKPTEQQADGDPNSMFCKKIPHADIISKYILIFSNYSLPCLNLPGVFQK